MLNKARLEAVFGDDEIRSRLRKPIFIVEQRGRIRVMADGQLRAEPYLDIADLLSSGNEQGLLALALHPDFQANGYAYVNYTNNDGDDDAKVLDGFRRFIMMIVMICLLYEASFNYCRRNQRNINYFKF